MNITVPTQALAKKLKIVEKIVAQKAIIPIMANALLRVDDGELKISTTDLEVSMTTSCPATVNAPGVITAPVKPLLNIVNQISDELTHLTLEKGHVRIAAGSFKMRLQTLSPDDFPTLPKLPEGGSLLPGDLFKQMIGKVRSAISDSDKRYFINGALFSLTENAIALIATDGKRLALTTAARTSPGTSLQVVVPTKTLDVLASDEAHDDILFAMGDRQMFFVSEDTVLSSRMIDGKFPDYKRIIPRENAHVATIPRLQVLSALRRVSLAAGDTRALTLLLEKDALSLATTSAQLGDAVEHVPVTYDGPAMKVSIEWNFVMDFLNAAVNQNVTLSLKDTNTASLWADGGDYINVIMLMRA